MNIEFDGTKKLPKQFVISKSIPKEYKDWTPHRLNDWVLASSPEVPVITLKDENSALSGFLVGWVIDEGDLLTHGTLRTVPSDQENEFLDRLCGRYIYIFSNNQKTYVRLDAGGLLPFVYYPKQECGGSTPTALLPFGQLHINEPLQQAFGVPEKHGWYPFGLTPFQDVVRLLPNHQLCLEDWHSTRVWPTSQQRDLEEPAIIEHDPKATTLEIAKHVQANIGAIVRGGKGISHLTAGYDSRMVVAATKPFLNSVLFETVKPAGEQTTLDCHVAGEISKKLRLKHEFLESIPTPKHKKDAWLYRTGNCVSDFVTDLAATAEHYDRHYHAITGTCGEVARAYYWSSGLKGGKLDVSSKELLARLGSPETPETLKAANDWIANLPVRRESLFWDLAYIEQRLACWAGPSVFGHNVSFPSLSPFNSHQIYKLMLSLPDRYKSSHQFVDDYIEYLWPELSQFPFNRAIGLAKLKFAKSELKEMLPASVKKKIKAVLKR